jgi:hypothetical protein
MDGWLGMALYGVKAGMEYDVGAGEVVSADSVASEKATVGSRYVNGESHLSPGSGSGSRKSRSGSDVGGEEFALEDERADAPFDAAGGAQEGSAEEAARD